MITTAKLARTVVQNSMRNRGKFALSAFGIVLGIGSAVFFLGLSLGVRQAVLDVFPLERVEVIAPRTSLLGKDTSKKIDDALVEQIRARPDVVAAVPRMAIAFPSVGYGKMSGMPLKVELVGDGIDPSFLEGDSFAKRFKDWEAEDESTLATCGPPPRYRCEGELRYCDRRIGKCRHRVPMIVSPNIIEIYNQQFATTHNLPHIGGFEQFVVQRGGLHKMRVHIALGETMFAINKKLEARPYEVEGTLLGVSDKAIPIGITLPIQYVRRWNREFVGEEAASTYSSVVVTLRSKDDVAGFGSWLVTELDLRLEDQQGERFAMVIVIVTALFLLISLIIVSISAINIAHNFFMQVTERKREIGIMRAVGATRRDVRRVILGEAALIGVVAGFLGAGCGVGAAALGDLLAARNLPEFAFKPETFFQFEWWIPVSALVFSVVFCVVGGFLPARRAARLPPAQALAQP